MYLFILVAASILTLVGSLVGFRLLLPLRMPLWGLVFTWAVTQLLLYLPLLSILLRRAGTRLPDMLIHMAWLVTGAFTILLFLLLGRDLLIAGLKLGGWLVRLGQGADPAMMEEGRRLFMTRGAGIALLGISGALTALGLRRAYGMTRLEEVSVPIAGLHPDLEGLRLVQFSDLHVGASVKRKHVEAVAARIMELKPDLIVFTGDLADGVAAELQQDVEPLEILSAPLGVMAVTGNHEYYTDPAGWMRAIPKLGMDLLVNESRVLRVGNARMRVGGVPDISAQRMVPRHVHRPDLALEGEAVEFNLLLAHQPKSVYAAESTPCDLMLCGHTHGGQYHPFTMMADKANPYLSGLNRHGRMWVYVSRGTGFWGPPIRIGAPPEITVLTLKRA